MEGDFMDEMDFKILELIESNGRISHEEIGKRLNLSRPAIHQRVNKLEQKGIILGYNTNIDWSKTGQVIKAFISINVRTNDFNKIISKITQINIHGLTIEECYRITGQWCIMLKIRSSFTDQITILHDELLRIEGMLDTSTVLILSEAEKPY
jgi:Lrp/AsnC family leucine-responsive transcriptional regulator